MTSFSPKDIEEGWCGNCRNYTSYGAKVNKIRELIMTGAHQHNEDHTSQTGASIDIDDATVIAVALRFVLSRPATKIEPELAEIYESLRPATT